MLIAGTMRQVLTRSLCAIYLVAALIGLLVGPTMAFLLIFRPPVFGALLNGPAYSLIFKPFLVLGLAALASYWVLRLWRTCDRCHDQLFTDYGSSRNRGLTVVRERDYRAKRLFGSYVTRAILNTAINGTTRCQWCGHLDGSTPDYVVKS